MSNLKTQKTMSQPSNKNMTIQKKKTSNPKSTSTILQLQQMIGNQGMQRLINSRGIQAKLTIGQPNDQYEQEADRVADTVMSMPESTVQRQVGEEEEDILQTKAIGDGITPLVQRKPEEEEELLQTKANGETAQITSNLETKINALQGSGQPLSKETKNFFEPGFGQDFSRVRVHNDANAHHLARSINARAFTRGSDVVFGGGEYNPNSYNGKRLLGHELTHVVQQRSNLSRKNLSQKNMTFQKSSDKIQKDPIAIAGLGLAVFGTGRSIVSSGKLSHSSTPATYMHAGTPISATWRQMTTTLHIKSWHPRYFIGNQNFYFRLEYEYNGYDIKNATINLLRSRSSSIYSSTFDITWSPSNESRPNDPISKIIFNISGQWDPVGRGDYSFWGRLIISASLSGSAYQRFSIDSEERSVWRV